MRFKALAGLGTPLGRATSSGITELSSHPDKSMMSEDIVSSLHCKGIAERKQMHGTAALKRYALSRAFCSQKNISITDNICICTYVPYHQIVPLAYKRTFCQ